MTFNVSSGGKNHSTNILGTDHSTSFQQPLCHGKNPDLQRVLQVFWQKGEKPATPDRMNLPSLAPVGWIGVFRFLLLLLTLIPEAWGRPPAAFP